MHVRLADGTTAVARIKGKKLRPVCGDRVEVSPIEAETDWLITGILPRDNELTRPDSRGRIEVLAANFSCLVVVAAPTPEPDWFIVDRYLAAAEIMGATAILVFNKSDLGQHKADESLNIYRKIGYTVVPMSAKSSAGVTELGQLLHNQTSIIVGQSGVGKSSIINLLASDADLRTGSVSETSKEGRHTTVNSELIDLPGGGAVIDSPGVRDYAPFVESSAQVETGFPEIARYARDCRFANCAHLREPGCAVKDAVESDGIDARRYESYRRLLSMTRRFAEGRFK